MQRVLSHHLDFPSSAESLPTPCPLQSSFSLYLLHCKPDKITHHASFSALITNILFIHLQPILASPLPPYLVVSRARSHHISSLYPGTILPLSNHPSLINTNSSVAYAHCLFSLKVFLIRLYFCVLAIILLLCFLSPPFRISVPTPHHSRPAFYFSSTSTGTFLAMTFITRRLGSASDGVAALPGVLAYEDWNQNAYTPIYVYTQSLIEMCPSYQRDKIYKNMRYTFHSVERSKRKKKGTR